MADQELFMQNMLTELTTSQRFTEGTHRLLPDRVNYDPASPLNGRRVAFWVLQSPTGSSPRGFLRRLPAGQGRFGRHQGGRFWDHLGRYRRQRLLKADETALQRSKAYDLFVCQLSTNDTRHGATLGERTGNEQREGFDLSTTLGRSKKSARTSSRPSTAQSSFTLALTKRRRHLRPAS